MLVFHELNMCKYFCRIFNTFLLKLIIFIDQGQAVREGRNYMIACLNSIHKKKAFNSLPLPLNMGCVNYTEA
jgi:hypothetical protein